MGDKRILCVKTPLRNIKMVPKFIAKETKASLSISLGFNRLECLALTRPEKSIQS